LFLSFTEDRAKMKLLCLILIECIVQVFCCSNIIVTPGASKNRSTIYAYSADSAGLYGTIDRYPRQENVPVGTMRKIWDWDSGLYIGSIPEARTTYDVVGNMNEYMLTIGETTFGGLESLMGTEGLIDYGTLIILGLQRSKTAREALKVMTDLVATYGYASEGESFTIADKNEVFVLEMTGKGKGYKGAVWVGKKVPDGHVLAHANQARITTFLEKDLLEGEKASDIFYSEDVVSFAIEKGLYDPKSKVPFSFSDVYDPLTFGGARYGEARVYSFFTKVTSIPDFKAKFEQYALGNDLSVRMPWSVPVTAKLDVRDVMKHMKDHHDGTSLNMQHDVGSGSWNAKFRDRPIHWDYKGDKYVNERTIGTQQSAWSFVSEMRQNMPNHVGICFWWGPDDATFSVLVPFYPFSNIPVSLRTKTGAIDQFTFDSQFWINNVVANKVYHQWEMLSPIVEEELWKLQDQFLDSQKDIESAALQKSADGSRNSQMAASRFLSDQTEEKAALLKDKWLMLWMKLVVHYRDGVVVGYPKKGHDHGGEIFGGAVAECKEVQWRDAWKKAIVDQAGDHFRIKNTVKQASEFKNRVLTEKNTNFSKKVARNERVEELIDSVNRII